MPLVLTVAAGVHRLVLLAGVFFFALAMAATALQGGPGLRTVEVTFPHGAEQTAPVSAVDAPAP
ncbi:MAG TPA: hypothetical protein VMZ00_16760 [Sporichthya sp.]|nr:hypothetical protein [Sporichthya sp.]